MLGGVVACPSIYQDLFAGYRDEVLLARSLAARGIAVQRFHYRGAGHSDGDVAGAITSLTSSSVIDFLSAA